MPITDLQAHILRLLASHRSPESYLAGATVLQRSPDSPRSSEDLDFFHDLAESVAKSAEADAAALASAGIPVEWLIRTPTFYRAIVSFKNENLRLEWAQDSAFRFFPVQADAWCGYRLHDVDVAINKILALAGREEVRDFIDVLHVHDRYLSAGALTWAACGKDPGFTPAFLLDQAGRHVCYTQEEVNRLNLRQAVDVKELKRQWLSAVDQAKRLFASLPEAELGCLYIDSKRSPVTPDPAAPAFPQLTRHYGKIRGSWPTVMSV